MRQLEWDFFGDTDVDISVLIYLLCFPLAGAFVVDTPGAAIANFTGLLSVN